MGNMFDEHRPTATRQFFPLGDLEKFGTFGEKEAMAFHVYVGGVLKECFLEGFLVFLQFSTFFKIKFQDFKG